MADALHLCQQYSLLRALKTLFGNHNGTNQQRMNLFLKVNVCFRSFLCVIILILTLNVKVADLQ